MPEELEEQKVQAATTSDKNHLRISWVRDSKNNFCWKTAMSFSLHLRKASLAVKDQAMHFKNGSYFSNQSLPDDKCKHWAASPPLSLYVSSFLKPPPTPRKKKKKSPFSAVDTCVSSCLVRISNWDIHPVRASKLANPHAPLPCKGRASQARSGRRAAPVVPRVPGIPAILGSLRLQHSWAQEEGSCCATEGKWEAIYFKGFHALLQKTG